MPSSFSPHKDTRRNLHREVQGPPPLPLTAGPPFAVIQNGDAQAWRNEALRAIEHMHTLQDFTRIFEKIHSRRKKSRQLLLGFIPDALFQLTLEQRYIHNNDPNHNNNNTVDREVWARQWAFQSWYDPSAILLDAYCTVCLQFLFAFCDLCRNNTTHNETFPCTWAESILDVTLVMDRAKCLNNRFLMDHYQKQIMPTARHWYSQKDAQNGWPYLNTNDYTHNDSHSNNHHHHRCTIDERYEWILENLLHGSAPRKIASYRRLLQPRAIHQEEEERYIAAGRMMMIQQPSVATASTIIPLAPQQGGRLEFRAAVLKAMATDEQASSLSSSASSPATTTTTTTAPTAAPEATTTISTSKKKIQTETVLANAFVPRSIRGTLNQIPSLYLSAKRTVPDLHLSARQMRERLCPSVPITPLAVIESSSVSVAADGASPNANINGKTTVPLRFMQYHDLHYALWYRNAEFKGLLPHVVLDHADQINENESFLSSYVEIFEAMLLEERRDLLRRYERYTVYNASIRISSDLNNNGGNGNVDSKPNAEGGMKLASFEIKGITGARPAIQVGDAVVLRTTTSIAYPGCGIAPVELHLQCFTVERRASGNDIIFCTWLSDEDAVGLGQYYGPLEQSTYHIRIVPRTNPTLQCLTALSWLATLPKNFVRNLIFPNEAPSLQPLDDSVQLSFTSDLNTQQLSFVRSMVQRTLQPSFENVRPPLILTGPAGTGKTKTLECALREVLKISTSPSQRTRVLVCTPSHTAADNVIQRLSVFFNNTQLFRLYNADRPMATVPAHVLRFCRQQANADQFELPALEDLLNFEIIVCTCQDAHYLYLVGMTNHQLRQHRLSLAERAAREFKDCGISLSIPDEANEPHFTHLFIDEGAQATEPETLIPLSVVVDPIQGNRKVEIALVGDPRQLSPQVFSTKAANAGLARPWMERLLRRPLQALGGGDEAMLGPDMSNLDALLRYSFAKDGHEQLSFFLTANYRGHPSFLAMPSALFYADKLSWASYDRANRNEDLQNQWCERLRHVEALADPVFPRGTTWSQKQFHFPIHFRGVIGRDTSATVSSGTISEESWTNEEEAKVVSDIVQILTSQAGVGSDSLGVLAPFRGQVVLIRKLLREIGLAGVNVGTIDDFQGIEKEVIVLSLTRSTLSFIPHDVDRRIGVFGQKKQSNVALTRAEQLQIVVGNPDVLESDPHWKQWLWFCLRNGLWYGEEGNSRSHWEKLDDLPVLRTLPNDEDEDCVVVSRLEEILRGVHWGFGLDDDQGSRLQ